MAIKILNSIKYIVTIIFLFVGIVYIFIGNKILKDLTLDEKKLYVPSDLKNNTESNEEKLHINKDINEEKNLFVTQNINENEKQKVKKIIITVKKNDTFFSLLSILFISIKKVGIKNKVKTIINAVKTKMKVSKL